MELLGSAMTRTRNNGTDLNSSLDDPSEQLDLVLGDELSERDKETSLQCGESVDRRSVAIT